MLPGPTLTRCAEVKPSFARTGLEAASQFHTVAQMRSNPCSSAHWMTARSLRGDALAPGSPQAFVNDSWFARARVVIVDQAAVPEHPSGLVILRSQ